MIRACFDPNTQPARPSVSSVRFASRFCVGIELLENRPGEHVVVAAEVVRALLGKELGGPGRQLRAEGVALVLTVEAEDLRAHELRHLGSDRQRAVILVPEPLGDMELEVRGLRRAMRNGSTSAPAE